LRRENHLQRVQMRGQWLYVSLPWIMWVPVMDTSVQKLTRSMRNPSKRPSWTFIMSKSSPATPVAPALYIRAGQARASILIVPASSLAFALVRQCQFIWI
jgi:hypothetical protein